MFESSSGKLLVTVAALFKHSSVHFAGRK